MSEEQNPSGLQSHREWALVCCEILSLPHLESLCISVIISEGKSRIPSLCLLIFTRLEEPVVLRAGDHHTP
ncbi:hypothetical protein AV530_003856 [Patagioenas fasciata monilis]|uniref:Uncharacterized protein n=1 Tax=Patagioenas fasciata monilis TaxID=372326 RepID=A0A1V4KYY2_PATFA|nr:hypothetical protein AV530_003856 [Patagioenas fasciata monilis]